MYNVLLSFLFGSSAGQVRSGQVRVFKTCTFRASCCSACLSCGHKYQPIAGSSVRDRAVEHECGSL